MKKSFITYTAFVLLATSRAIAAEADATGDGSDAPKKPAAASATKASSKGTDKSADKATDKATDKASDHQTNQDAANASDTGDSEDAGNTEAESSSPRAAKAAEGKKPTAKSASSKALDGRLSLGTSVGWAAVKPSKGTWTGLGAADFGVRWRASAKSTGNLYYTGRYAPFSGVWTVDHRDYDTTLHGLYGGAEYQRPIHDMTLKAGVELGYMLVYARPQDNAPAAGDVKGGKVNMTAGAGADWSFFSDKVKLGPFARVHVAGFNMFHLGGSAQFVF
jgi:hypothetical protein